MKAANWSLAVFFACLGAAPAATADTPDAGRPMALVPGVHLLLDDRLIDRSEGVARRVVQPQRFLSEPVVTGAVEHQNWQPFLTVLHDADPVPAGRFRMWYNADAVDDPADGAFFGVTGYLESADGVRWPGPYERLESLTVDGRVRFGANVLDDGPDHVPAAERYKMLYFDAGQQAGPRAAFSPDGRNWTVYDGGRPVLAASNGDDIWSAAYDPVRRSYFLFGKTYGPHTWTNAEGREVTANVRRYFTSVSPDFKTWSKPVLVFSPDERDEGITQWYGPAGFLVRGETIVAFLRELRDDLSPADVPPEAVEANVRGKAGLGGAGSGMGSGMGHTVLAWTHDGETWRRDRFADKFFEPDPQTGAWDHAISWIGSAVPMGDEVLLYYAGYRWGHKYRHSVDRQLGLVKMPRDRFVAWEAGEAGGSIVTRPLTLDAEGLTLNVDAAGGAVSVEIVDGDSVALPGFSRQDCRPIATDSLSAAVEWRAPLASLRGRTLRLEFFLESARLFAFEIR